MNIPLLLKVKAAILAEPRKFDMALWFKKNDVSPCGTTACIAGHAVAIQEQFHSLREGFQTGDHPEELAKKYLEVGRIESERLFYGLMWPPEFKNRLNNCKTPRGRAKVAADRIDRFIETEGCV